MNRLQISPLTAALNDSGAALVLPYLVKMHRTGVLSGNREIFTDGDGAAGQTVPVSTITYDGGLCLSNTVFDKKDDIGLQLVINQIGYHQNSKTFADYIISQKPSVMAGDVIYGLFKDTFDESTIRNAIDVEEVTILSDFEDTRWFFVFGKSKVNESPEDNYNIGDVLGGDVNYALWRFDNLAPVPKLACE